MGGEEWVASLTAKDAGLRFLRVAQLENHAGKDSDVIFLLAGDSKGDSLLTTAPGNRQGDKPAESRRKKSQKSRRI